MKLAKDFRKIAREALTGKWSIAVIVALVASLLGGLESGGPELDINIDGSSSMSANLNFAGQTVYSTGTNSDISPWLIGGLGFIIIVALIIAAIYLVLGSFVGVGYAKFNLNLVDKKETAFETLFGYFTYWKTTTATRLLKTLYIFLWSLLLVIPGIVAGYSYAMTEYILAESPNITASEAIQRSKVMMYGNRWRLFCLEFSFIGWSILATLTFGIGYLWLTPYMQAAKSAFFREISGTGYFLEESVSDMN